LVFYQFIILTFKQLNSTESTGQTKVQQLVHAITGAISSGKLKNGDPLPSVNQLSKDSGFSRDTVFKAYNILKVRNIIESAPTKGYYVANESFKVLMLLDDFSAFKEQLYQSFRQNLPDSFSVDLLFHHYNKEVFNQLIESSLGRYSAYVVMNISNKNVAPVLKKMDAKKLLILDMGKPGRNKYSFIVQDFKVAVLACLNEQQQRIKKYNHLVMVYSEKNTPHPAETVTAVEQFCKVQKMNFHKTATITEAQVKPDTLYFIFRDSDLVPVVKACRNKKYKLGNDVGVLSYNDTPMKEIIGGGISVISIKFDEMGRLAAEFVKNKQPVEIVLPTFLTLRQSL